MLRSLSITVALVAAATGLSAKAEEKKETSPWTTSLSLVSDYAFRGITQTSEKPALQGALE